MKAISLLQPWASLVMMIADNARRAWDAKN